jgi:hypothetical protein
LLFLAERFGVQRGQFTFEGHDLQDYRGAIVRGQFTESVAEFFAGSVIEKVAASSFHWATMKVLRPR